MKYILILLCMLGTACGGWSKRDTLTELGFAATTTRDWQETDSIVQGCREQNPIMGACGDRVSPDIYMPGAIVLHTVVSALLPRGWARTTWQAITIGAELRTLYGNHEIQWWLTRDPNAATRDPNAAH